MMNSMCNDNYFPYQNSNYFNCYENCNHYYYFDDDNNYHSTNNLSCPNNFPLLKSDSNECIHSDNTFESSDIFDTKFIEKSSDIILNKSLITTIIETLKFIENNGIENVLEDILHYEKNKTEFKNKTEEIEYYDTIIDKIENIFTSPNFDTSNIDNGKDEIIKTEKMTITLTTTQNQKDNIFNNITMIDLGEC